MEPNETELPREVPPAFLAVDRFWNSIPTELTQEGKIILSLQDLEEGGVHLTRRGVEELIGLAALRERFGKTPDHSEHIDHEGVKVKRFVTDNGALALEMSFETPTERRTIIYHVYDGVEEVFFGRYGVGSDDSPHRAIKYSPIPFVTAKGRFQLTGDDYQPGQARMVFLETLPEK